MKKVFILILCIFFTGGVFFFLEKNQISKQSETGKKITELPMKVLEKKDFTYIKNYVGNVEAIKSVAIVSYLSAFLKEVYVQSGQQVTKDEVLFLLDQKIPLADLNQAKEAVSQAKAKLQNAKDYYERMKNTDPKAISSIDLEQAKSDYDAAEAAYQKAIAAENQAQTVYNYTIIKAPFSGWVGDITATVGEYLSPESESLARIVSFSPVRLAFSIPMSDYKGDVFANDKAILQVVLSDKTLLEFKKFQIARDNRADKSTDSLRFFIDVPNDDKLLVPDSYVEVRFLYSENGILVNKDWITLTPNGAEAILLKNGILERQNVEIGAYIGNQYWIQSGLFEKDKIITVPVSPFQIGQPAKGITQ